MSVLAARWIGLPVIEGQHFALDTASLSILGYQFRHPDIPVMSLWKPPQPSSRATTHIRQTDRAHEAANVLNFGGRHAAVPAIGLHLAKTTVHSTLICS
jgi:hypothetical protein